MTSTSPPVWTCFPTTDTRCGYRVISSINDPIFITNEKPILVELLVCCPDKQAFVDAQLGRRATRHEIFPVECMCHIKNPGDRDRNTQPDFASGVPPSLDLPEKPFKGQTEASLMLAFTSI